MILGVAGVIEFTQVVFGATEIECHTQPDGRIMHAEVRIGDSVVMMGETDDPSHVAPAMLYVMVRDVDAAYRRALEAGGTSLQEPADQHYGHRSAGVADRSGNKWWIASPL